MICSIIEKNIKKSCRMQSAKKTCKTRGIDTSESSFVAYFGVF